jgi:hypothetical protein
MNTTHGTTPRFAGVKLSQVPLDRNGESSPKAPLTPVFKPMLQIWHGQIEGN